MFANLRIWTALFAVVFGLAVVSAAAAHQTVGFVCAGLLLDPFGSYSAFGLPEWHVERSHLRFPDRVVAVEGEAVDVRPGRLPARAVERRLGALRARGREAVRLRFERAGRPFELSRPLFVLGPLDVGLLFGSYALVGLLLLWSGVTVIALARDRAAGLAYGFWTAASATVMVTFFDYHTTAWVAPAFSVGTTLFSLGCVLMIYAFPTPPARFRRLTRAAVVALTVALLAAAAALALAPRLSVDLTALRQVVGAAGPLSALGLIVTLMARYRARSSAARVELRSALWGLGAVLSIIAVGVLLTMLTGSIVGHLVAPVILPLIPLSIGASLVRHNLLGSTSLLTRRLFVIPVFLVAVAGALLAWLALRLTTPVTGVLSILATFISGGVFVTLVVYGHRLVDRVLFSARSEFRPTLEQLSTELASLQHHDEVRDALRRVIVRWLPSARVDVLAPDELHRVEALPAGALTRLSAGDIVWTEESPWARDLLLPMRSLGGLRGVLRVGPKRHGALYTGEDVSLLKTIASLGAVSMHNADALEDLEDLRRTEVEATRGERDQTLGIVSAEVAHEVSHPLQFIRTMLRRISRGQSADPEDIKAGEEEIQRLERLLGRLRRMQPPSLQRRPIRVRESVDRALVFLREPLAERSLKVTVDVPADLVLSVDPDPLLQLFANLLRNAAQAAPAGGNVGVSAHQDGGDLVLDVWDDGPGIPASVVEKLFRPWFTTRADGTGLGLRICQDIARRFEWSIESLREEPRTIFRLRVPAAQCVPASPERPTPAS